MFSLLGRILGNTGVLQICVPRCPGACTRVHSPQLAALAGARAYLWCWRFLRKNSILPRGFRPNFVFDHLRFGFGLAMCDAFLCDVCLLSVPKGGLIFLFHELVQHCCAPLLDQGP